MKILLLKLFHYFEYKATSPETSAFQLQKLSNYLNLLSMHGLSIMGLWWAMIQKQIVSLHFAFIPPGLSDILRIITKFLHVVIIRPCRTVHDTGYFIGAHYKLSAITSIYVDAIWFSFARSISNSSRPYHFNWSFGGGLLGARFCRTVSEKKHSMEWRI